MPRRPYWLHFNRQDFAWEVRVHGESYVFHHVPEPKPPGMKPLLRKGRKP